MPIGEDGKFVSPVVFRRHLRKHRTPAEKVLWEYVSGTQTGFRFTQQFHIDGDLVDLCCRSHRVVIELDGSSHENRVEEDQERDARLVSKGYVVLRFANDEVLNRPDRVVQKIRESCEGRPQYRY